MTRGSGVQLPAACDVRVLTCTVITMAEGAYLQGDNDGLCVAPVLFLDGAVQKVTTLLQEGHRQAVHDGRRELWHQATRLNANVP